MTTTTAARGKAKPSASMSAKTMIDSPSEAVSSLAGEESQANLIFKTDKGIVHIEMKSFIKAYRALPDERILLIRDGLPAKAVDEMANAMDFSKDSFLTLLGMPRATVNRKARNHENLSPEHTERLLGIAQLIGKVQAMVEESGDAAEFDAAKWVKDWLNTELPALGGRRPAEYMDTMEGQKFVSNLLEMTQNGAYA